MENNATVKIIYTLLKSCEEYRSDANCAECEKRETSECNSKSCKWHYIPSEKGGRALWGVDYLLGQILRQIDVPDERRHLSDKAQELWGRLEIGEDIWRYSYQDTVNYDLSAPVSVKRYKGASSQPENGGEVLEGKGHFIFREVFHDEHIVPIGDILESLMSIKKEQLTEEMISDHLDRIRICRMLKSEDREIHKKYKRGCDLDYERIYEKYYREKGVIISEFEEKV